MTLDEVKTRVESIRRRRGDDEGAHGMEDDLYCDVLQAIADGTHEDDPSVLAAEALKTRKIDFARWCG